ncbi:MAG: aspartate aminotransferase family protein, partial [Candidatus Saliniplasma sp.]
IISALEEQMGKGTMYGLPHEASEELAKQIIDRFPVEKIRFTNSGSESTMYAVRVARRYTGKDKILKIEGTYHGVMDSLHISKTPPLHKTGPAKRPARVPAGEGITDKTVEDTLVAPFNDLEKVEELLDENLGEVAAIIVEPVMMNKGVIPPFEGYLKNLKKLAEEHNVLLIFDEVKTGVKMARGGAAEYYGIEPDIITLAKAIGGGLPLGACAGKEEIMNGIGDEGLFGTYSANPLAVEAGKATLGEILTKDAYDEVKNYGEKLMDGYRDIIEDHELTALVQGVNAIGTILFTEKEVKNYRDWTQVDQEKTHEYWLSMVNEGVIPTAYGADEQWLISVQHTESDIEKHLETFKKVAPKIE